MHGRIEHLEVLVKRLIDQNQRFSPLSKDAARTPARPKPEVGSTVSVGVPGAGSRFSADSATIIDASRSVYHNENDWYTVLQEIKEIKKTWSQEQDDESEDSIRPNASHAADGSSLLFQQVKPVERMDILSALPPKTQADRLVSYFFDRQSFPISVPPILHEPTFRKHYNDHWRDPDQTNIIWLGLLFSMLGITMLAYHQYGEPPEYEGISESLFHLYRTRTAQCLLSGDIAKCLPYTVETLRFNATAELNRKDDSRRGLWIMTGVIVRTAVNMGYHRDPGANANVSVLQAEYRRRIWLTVISMDDMTSFFAGFPRTRSMIYSDTKEPRNLHDWELSDDATASLPPSRPLSEVTETTYLIVKGRLLCALGRISDFNSGPTPDSYVTVLEIDRAVYTAYNDFPEHMKVPSLNDMSLPIRTMAGFSNLSLLCMYHTGMCTLHRRFLARGKSNNEFQFSRDRCISSALGTLDFQRVVEPSFYRMSQTRQVLILAAMILFLEIEVRRQDPCEGEVRPDTGILVHALEESCTLWAQAMDACDESWKVHRFLVGMLSNLNVNNTGSASGSGGGSTSSQAGSMTAPVDLTSVSSDTQADSYWKEFSFENELSNVDFDWATWDAFIEDAD
ncbi:hypothetical protein PV08_04981 [Exophiala spinifera]|uniref:Xylanolytic transcriptional activator regulatory domain-containing protein n=1 Tax=Exophiala spinifera TaxID=91928 RepID=A0A0D1YRA3_9EURO|nr:uncharacterized protein PV08_04981 [Exophiala spinifera]KIW17786.1 hypothetical protein PV08_04981 [Exophiala spinifera]